MSNFKKMVIVGFTLGEYILGTIACIGYFVLKNSNFTGTVILINCFAICLEGLIKFCIYDRVNFEVIFVGIFD